MSTQPTHHSRAVAHADMIRERLQPTSATRRDAVAKALGKPRYAPAETPYYAPGDDGANLDPELNIDEITGRFEAVVLKAIRESQHDDDRAVLVPPSTPPVLHRVQRTASAVAKIVASIAAAVGGLVALAKALGWF